MVGAGAGWWFNPSFNCAKLMAIPAFLSSAEDLAPAGRSGLAKNRRPEARSDVTLPADQ